MGAELAPSASTSQLPTSNLQLPTFPCITLATKSAPPTAQPSSSLPFGSSSATFSKPSDTMKTPYLFEQHLPASTLLRNLKSTHTGAWVYNTWPVASCTTDAWTRLVILPFYHQKRYPKEYYTPEATISEL